MIPALMELHSDRGRKAVLIYMCMQAKLLSRVQLCDPWTAACQDPLFMGFSRQEYWSAFLCPSPGDLPDPGIKPLSLTSPALADRFFMFCSIPEDVRAKTKSSKSEGSV